MYGTHFHIHFLPISTRLKGHFPNIVGAKYKEFDKTAHLTLFTWLKGFPTIADKMTLIQLKDGGSNTLHLASQIAGINLMLRHIGIKKNTF